jgi:Tfp pilus assembly protein PilF
MGMMHKQSGAPDKAREHFERTLKTDPRHLDAAREMRLLDAHDTRRRPGSGLLERLLGRKPASVPPRRRARGHREDDR